MWIIRSIFNCHPRQLLIGCSSGRTDWVVTSSRQIRRIRKLLPSRHRNSRIISQPHQLSVGTSKWSTDLLTLQLSDEPIQSQPARANHFRSTSTSLSQSNWIATSHQQLKFDLSAGRVKVIRVIRIVQIKNLRHSRSAIGSLRESYPEASKDWKSSSWIFDC